MNAPELLISYLKTQMLLNEETVKQVSLLFSFVQFESNKQIDTELNLPSSAKLKDVKMAMKGHVLQESKINCWYQNQLLS